MSEATKRIITEMIDKIHELPADEVEIVDLKKLQAAALSKAKEKMGS